MSAYDADADYEAPDYGDMAKCEVCEGWGDDLRSCVYCHAKSHPACEAFTDADDGEAVCSGCLDQSLDAADRAKAGAK